MNKYEIARYEANARAEKFMNDHDIELISIDLYSMEKVKFTASMNALEAAKNRQVVDTKVFVVKKSALKEAMAASVYKFILRASVQASQLGLVDIELALDRTMTYLSKCEDVLAVDRAEELKNIIKNNLSQLTSVTAVDIAQMEGDIAAFNEVRDLPEDEMRERKINGTALIPGLLGKLDVSKDHIGKLIISYLPQYAGEWNEIIRVGDPEGVRHNSVAVRFTDYATDAPLKNVCCTITNGFKTVTRYSTRLGWVRFYSLDSGNWIITSEYATHENDIRYDVGVMPDDIVRLNIALKKRSGQDEQENTTGILSLFSYDRESGDPLESVQVSLPELNYVGSTDEDGELYLDGITPGTYTGSLFYDGYRDMPFTFDITAARITMLQLMMDKEV